MKGTLRGIDVSITTCYVRASRESTTYRAAENPIKARNHMLLPKNLVSQSSLVSSAMIRGIIYGEEGEEIKTRLKSEPTISALIRPGLQ